LLKYEEITERIIQGFFSVYNSLGVGFLEKVYENALRVELIERGLAVRQQAPIQVTYHGQTIGE
jgi:GxxExxY protein